MHGGCDASCFAQSPISEDERHVAYFLSEGVSTEDVHAGDGVEARLGFDRGEDASFARTEIRITAATSGT